MKLTKTFTYAFVLIMLLLTGMTGGCKASEPIGKTGQNNEASATMSAADLGGNNQGEGEDKSDLATSKLFDQFFTPYATGEKPLFWDDIKAALAEEGYTAGEDEGTFSVDDPEYPENWLGGGLTTRTDPISIATLAYYMYSSDRKAEADFEIDGSITYYIDVTAYGRKQVNSFDELKAYLFSPKSADSAQGND